MYKYDESCNLSFQDEETPLHYAVEYKRSDIVQLLLNKTDIDPNKGNKNGETPLHFAARNGSHKIVQMLLERTDIDPNKGNKNGETPLHFAARNGSHEIVQMLLERTDIDPNKGNKNGETPLHFAARNGSHRIVQMLLERTDIDPNKGNKLSNLQLPTLRASIPPRQVLLQGDLCFVLLKTSFEVYLTLDEKRTIRLTERNKTSEEAMILLLDKFDEKDSPGKWTAFRAALVEADYEWIIRAIEGKDVNFTELTTWQNMINIFTKKIVGKIIPSRLLHDLCNAKIISEQESEEINKEEQYRGDTSAAFLLLISIPRRNLQWYPKFMEILFLNGWDEVVAEVDSDEWKRTFVPTSRSKIILK
ncbi:unnamed protein product [Mytilus edulis]|uniref:Caspase recruitment domain-containing protein n=1 Tax=Mytilus edulis TaxID=6550 RepID=A0A8S3RBQ6_MYTED|nr:unnamed protein product [Mytilus edulis]